MFRNDTQRLAISTQAPEASSPIGATGMATVLILDDADSLLTIIAAYLESSGHRTLFCSSFESAHRQFIKIEGAVDLLVAGITPGSRSCVEIGLGFLESARGVKVLFISGHPYLAWQSGATNSFYRMPSDLVRVLETPFSPLELLLKVDELVSHLPANPPACRRMA